MLQVFLRQEGHVSADDLFDLVRREAAGIGRATVYRTLQWLVGAGIARKVDFGEGRSRFEPSYRHPRHFHLICTNCHSSSEFLSSDVEALLEEIAAARNFRTKQATVQIHGVCEQCSTGHPTPPVDGSTTGMVFARDALRMAIATERSGLDFYTRAAGLTKDPRGRTVFQRERGELVGVPSFPFAHPSPGEPLDRLIAGGLTQESQRVDRDRVVRRPPGRCVARVGEGEHPGRSATSARTAHRRVPGDQGAVGEHRVEVLADGSGGEAERLAERGRRGRPALEQQPGDPFPGTPVGEARFHNVIVA